MDTTEALEFLASNNNAVLATTRASGDAQMSPVLAVAHDGRVLVSTREAAIKTRNLRRRPRASVMVMSPKFFGPWIQITGPVEIISLPEAMDLLVEYYRLAAGERDDWEEYKRAMEQEGRCIIAITPERVGPTVSG